MENRYTKLASIPDDEKIVAVTRMWGGFYWDFKYPFRHLKEERYFIATEKCVYELSAPPLPSPQGIKTNFN